MVGKSEKLVYLFFCMMDYRIYWCRVNKYYLNKWLSYFNDTKENSIIVSTCVVTQRAKKKVIKQILKDSQLYDKIYITWCFSIQNWILLKKDEFLTKYPELELVIDKIELLDQEPIISDEKIYFDFKEIYTKKFVLIQNWCDNHCTFCLSIIKRGSWKSRPIEQIIQQIDDYVKKWAKEIVLTGINLAAYWATNTRKPSESKFVQLLDKILRRTSIERIRISSLWPEYITPELLKIFENTRIMPFFHISIQSFSDNVLRKMNRNYSKEYLINVLNSINSIQRQDWVNISIGADLIVWFPWESDKDFQDTYDMVKQIWLSKLHVFPFSAHNQTDGIPAWKFSDQIAQDVKKFREKKLLELSNELRKQFIKLNIGKSFHVLIEEKKNGKWYGWTPNYIQMAVEGNFKKWDLIELVLKEENLVE